MSLWSHFLAHPVHCTVHTARPDAATVLSTVKSCRGHVECRLCISLSGRIVLFVCLFAHQIHCTTILYNKWAGTARLSLRCKKWREVYKFTSPLNERSELKSAIFGDNCFVSLHYLFSYEWSWKLMHHCFDSYSFLWRNSYIKRPFIVTDIFIKACAASAANQHAYTADFIEFVT